MHRLVPPGSFVAYAFLFVAAAAPTAPQSPAPRDSLQPLFERANALSTAGDSEAAVALYRRVLRTEPRSIAVRYNLATTLARADRSADALREYLGVLRRAPRDPAARHNAAVVRGRLREAAGRRAATIADLPAPPQAWLAADEAAWVALVLLNLAALAAVVGLALRRGRVAAVVAGLIFVAASAFGAVAARAALARPLALVTRAGAGALAGPSSDQPQVLTLPAGAAVRMGERRAGWILVSLPNGLSGWMPETDVARVP